MLTAPRECLAVASGGIGDAGIRTGQHMPRPIRHLGRPAAGADLEARPTSAQASLVALGCVAVGEGPDIAPLSVESLAGGCASRCKASQTASH